MVSVLDKGEIMLMRSTINFPTLSLAAFGHMPLLIDRFESLPHNWQDGQVPHGHALGSGQAKPNFQIRLFPILFKWPTRQNLRPCQKVALHALWA